MYAIYKSDNTRPITSYMRLQSEDLMDKTDELIASATKSEEISEETKQLLSVVKIGNGS